jgi:hypothetical protein
MMMKSDKLSDSLEKQREKLEDSFFQEKDKLLIEKLKIMKKMQETKKTLSEISGIKNETILAKLVELEMRPETLACLALVPLVEVAWADGKISPEEEAAVLKAAEINKIKKDSIGYDLLKEWLRIKPKASMLNAWTHYIEGLCEVLTKKEIAALKDDFLGNAKEVAEASGGILGIGSISKEEKEMLKKLEKAFESKSISK